MPMIVSSTDIRYRFKKIALEVNRTGMPAVVVDKSRPLVKIWPYLEDRTYSLQTLGRDPEEINKTRRRLAKYVKGWDSTAAIRGMRDNRWNLSSTLR